METPSRELVEFIGLVRDVWAAIRRLHGESEIYAAVAEAFARAGRQTVCILLLDEDGQSLTMAAASPDLIGAREDESVTSAPVAHERIDVDAWGGLAPVLNEGRTIELSSGDTLGGLLAFQPRGAEPETYIVAPVRVHGQITGVLGVSFADGGAGCAPAATMLAESVSAAIERAQELAEHERVARELRRTEERARVLSETMSDFVYALRADPDGSLKREWAAGDIRRMTGYTLEELDARGGVLSIVHPDDRSRVLRRAYALLSGQPDQSEYRIIAKDGTVRWIRYYTHTIRGMEQGREVRIYGAAQDITEAKEAEVALRASEEQYRNLVENISEVIYALDARGVVAYVSPVVESVLGYAPAELVGRHFTELIIKEETPGLMRSFRRLLSGQAAEGDYRVRTSSGEVRWVHSSSMPVYQGEHLVGVRGALVDITERVQADQQLRAYRDHLEHLVDERTAQLRRANQRLALLSRRLMHAQESERRRIARELHDEIGQGLTALRMSLQASRRSHHAPEADPHLEDGIRIAEHTLQQVRDLSLDLRPSLLDDLGLVPALRWYLDRQAQRTGLAVELEVGPVDARLPADLEVACFRFVQEALTNAVRHAQARRVRVGLRRGDTEVELTVMDDGVGFDVEATLDDAAHGGSIGLLGMQERAQLAGGQMTIESGVGQGTLIRARFPLTTASGSLADEEAG